MHFCARLSLLLAVSAAAPALAADGVVEINPACASQGCFLGDSAGLPVTIDGSAGRSYRLSGDLVVPNENTSGIVVSASGVSIDLGGFEIRGANVCTGAPNDCTLTGSGRGVTTTGAAERLTVSNGDVVGMGDDGIRADGGNGHVVRDVRVSHNRRSGIFLAGNANSVRDATALLNGGTGITIGNGTLTSCTAGRNGSFGQAAGSGSVITSATAFQNGSNGIHLVIGGRVSNSSSRSNGGVGIFTGDERTVSGCSATSNTGHGIVAGARAHVSGCSSSNNTAAGLVLGDDAGYRENLITSNGVGAVLVVSGTLFFNLGDNACTNSLDATVACP